LNITGNKNKMNPIRKHIEVIRSNDRKADTWDNAIIEFNSELDPETRPYDFERMVKHKVEIKLRLKYLGWCSNDEMEVKRLEELSIRSMENTFYGFIYKELSKLHYMLYARDTRSNCIEQIEKIMTDIGL
jgi:hypothetical protein